jgi:membrane protein required for colicin V production|tara:strand:- start:1878 stop:2477 length:600 start_codon:yes stop_codon:yes gene_type:complete
MEALGLNLVDWTIIVILAASGVISFTRGFATEFLSLFLWLIAFVAAISLEYIATPKINEFIGNPEISKILAYVVVFLIFIFLGGMVIKFIKKLIKWSGASGFDKFLGVIFGLARGLLFLFVIFLLLPSSMKTSDAIVNSKITPIIEQYAPKVEAYFRDLIDNRNLVEEALEIIDPLITEPLKDELIPESNKENTEDEDS